MLRRVLACTLVILGSAAIIGLGAETFPYDHMHLNAADPAIAVAWYRTNLGAKNGAAADRVVFGRTIFAFAKLESAPPSAGGRSITSAFRSPMSPRRSKSCKRLAPR